MRLTVAMLATFLVAVCGSTAAFAARTSPSVEQYRGFLNPICKKDEARIATLSAKAANAATNNDPVKYWLTVGYMLKTVDSMALAIHATPPPAEFEATMRPANVILESISLRIMNFGSPGTNPARWTADLKAIGQLLNRLSPIMRSAGLTNCA
jgi:hypothetical protein